MDEDYRMKNINFLKIYGYYDGILCNMELQKKYISGELKLIDIIKDKAEFKKIKLSVNAVIDYCNNNYFDEIANVMQHFYKVECLDIRKQYGSFFDKI